MARTYSRPRLGRGLASLIGRPSEDAQPQPADGEPSRLERGDREAGPGGVRTVTVSVSQIGPNPYQPRREFDQAALEELAKSIRNRGLLQPILLTERQGPPDGYRYSLIAGERRLRAARLAGLQEVPAIVRPAKGAEMLELAVIENIHRSDLNPVERARAYRDLMEQEGLTQQEVAERLGQPRTTVANYLRLLELAEEVQVLVAEGALSFGHAKVLAGLTAGPEVQVALARRAVEGGLSVRQLEAAVRSELGQGGRGVSRARPGPEKSAYVRDVERQLSETIGTKVVVQPSRKRHAGRIVIEYYSLEDFDRITALLGAEIES